MKSILIPSIIDLLSTYNRLAALTMIIVGVESTLTMFGMRERAFFMLFGQLGMLFVFMCVCVSCVLILFLIVDIRNPLEEMVLKIYSTLIFAKSFDLWCVFNRSDVLFRFFI